MLVKSLWKGMPELKFLVGADEGIFQFFSWTFKIWIRFKDKLNGKDFILWFGWTGDQMSVSKRMMHWCIKERRFKRFYPIVTGQKVCIKVCKQCNGECIIQRDFIMGVLNWKTVQNLCAKYCIQKTWSWKLSINN